MDAAKSPLLSLVARGAFPRERTTPPPCKKSHPTDPHQQGAFPSSPGCRKSVLERECFPAESSDVKHRGVVDQKQASEREERQGEQPVQQQSEPRRGFVGGWFPKQPCCGPEGQPHGESPHDGRAVAVPQGLCSSAEARLPTTSRRISLVSSRRRGARQSRVW